MKDSQYKCRQNTCFIRVTKKTRENLHILAGNKETLQAYLENLTKQIMNGQ